VRPAWDLGRRLLAAFALELRRALRAPDTLKIRLLPGLLLVPTLMAVVLASVTLTDTRPVVALCPGGPDEAMVSRALLGQHLLPLYVADPRAAMEDGRAQAAVLSWEQAPGLGWRAWDPTPDARWTAHVAARSREVQGGLEDALAQVGEAMVAYDVTLAGGDPQRDGTVLSVVEDRPVGASGPLGRLVPTSPDGRWVIALSFLGVYGLMFSLPVLGINDRKQGIAEAMAVLPLPLPLLHAARLLAWALISGVSAAVLLGELALMVGDGLPLPSPAALVAALAALVLCASVMHVIGVSCRSPVTAMNLGPGAGLGLLGGLVGATHLAPPGWVPVLGLVSPDGPAAQLLGALSALLVSAALVTLAARLELRRIEEGA